MKFSVVIVNYNVKSIIWNSVFVPYTGLLTIFQPKFL